MSNSVGKQKIPYLDNVLLQCDTEFFFAQYKFLKNLDSVIGQKIDPFDSFF